MSQGVVAKVELDLQPQVILVVDADADFRRGISTYLAANNYRVETVAGQQEMKAFLGRQTVSLVVLGMLGPSEDSVSVCRALARPGGPAIIMVSPLTDVIDRIIAFEVGADDFLARTFNPRELLARLRAIFRRQSARSTGAEGTRHEFWGWRFDLLRRELFSPAGGLINLTANEFKLLCAFVERPRRLLSREYLLARTLGHDRTTYDRAIDVRVSRLRLKLSQGGRFPELIQTLRGKGYIFKPLISAF